MPAWSVEQATPEDIPSIRQLLFDTFQNPAPHLFTPEMLFWKAFDPHPWWEGGRSYVVRRGDARRGDEIVAQITPVPLRLKTASRTARAHCMIDWAARKDAIGSGIALYAWLRRRTDLQIAIGGSEQALRALPQMGFANISPVRVYTRVFRPAAHLMRVRGIDAGNLLRFGRDLREWTRGRGTSAGDLTAVPCEQFESGGDLCLPDPTLAGGAVFDQTAETLNYLLRCPAPMRGYRFEREGRPAGYAVLCRVGRQCRIASLWIASSQGDDWARGFTRAAQLAAEDPECTEIVVSASLPLMDSALVAAGFRVTNLYPFQVHKSQLAVLDGAPVSIELAGNDAFYI